MDITDPAPATTVRGVPLWDSRDLARAVNIRVVGNAARGSGKGLLQRLRRRLERRYPGAFTVAEGDTHLLLSPICAAEFLSYADGDQFSEKVDYTRLWELETAFRSLAAELNDAALVPSVFAEVNGVELLSLELDSELMFGFDGLAAALRVNTASALRNLLTDDDARMRDAVVGGEDTLWLSAYSASKLCEYAARYVPRLAETVVEKVNVAVAAQSLKGVVIAPPAPDPIESAVPKPAPKSSPKPTAPKRVPPPPAAPTLGDAPILLSAEEFVSVFVTEAGGSLAEAEALGHLLAAPGGLERPDLFAVTSKPHRIGMSAALNRLQDKKLVWFDNKRFHAVREFDGRQVTK